MNFSRLIIGKNKRTLEVKVSINHFTIQIKENKEKYPERFK
jgi:hypothetical protein